MAIDIDQLFERIKEVDIRGIVSVDCKILGKGEDTQPVIEICFLRLKGALKNDPEQTFRMVIGADHQEEKPNDLAFLVVDVDECEAFSKTMTLYMDANGYQSFGGFRWVPEKNVIRFKYCLPLPDPADEYLDIALLRRILVNIYEALLFPDAKVMKWQIDEDDMLNDKEKEEKKDRLDDFIARLLGPKDSRNDEGV